MLVTYSAVWEEPTSELREGVYIPHGNQGNEAQSLRWRSISAESIDFRIAPTNSRLCLSKHGH